MQTTTIEIMIERLRLQMIQRKYSLEPPCTDEEIKQLIASVEHEFNVLLADRCLDLLKITDGLEENALDIFGSRQRISTVGLMKGRDWLIRGIVEENREYRDNFKDYNQLLIFAYREGYVYAQVISTGLFVKLSETEDDPRKLYETFDEMMIDAIQNALVN